jgi:hypothetical protein
MTSVEKHGHVRAHVTADNANRREARRPPL